MDKINQSELQKCCNQSPIFKTTCQGYYASCNKCGRQVFIYGYGGNEYDTFDTTFTILKTRWNQQLNGTFIL